MYNQCMFSLTLEYTCSKDLALMLLASWLNIFKEAWYGSAEM